MTPSEHLQNGTETATDLLARRAQLQEWLARLGEVSGDIPAQVARRVREDYEQRLAAVVAELSVHSEALAADREQLDEKLLAAAERHDAAVEALEEVRLRHMIGELSLEDWDSRRPELESEVEAAAGERAETEQAIAALDDLFRQIEGPRSEDEPTIESPTTVSTPDSNGEIAPGSFAEAAEEWDPELPILEDPRASEPEVSESMEEDAAGSTPVDISLYTAEEPVTNTPTSAGLGDDLVDITSFAAEAEALADEAERAPADEDYAFLEELDRAIAATAPAGGVQPEGEEEATPETRPQPGLKCPDCGYSNDPAAWYCGVCGVDLG